MLSESKLKVSGRNLGDLAAEYRSYMLLKGLTKYKRAQKRLRRFKETLDLLGFSTWLDEDAMAAGELLERGLLEGFRESCAAVFFVTPNFSDEGCLQTEIDYAIQEKRKKEDRFS